MILREAFAHYRAEQPEAGTQVERTFLPLRRGGISTLEQLWDVYQNEPQRLQRLRGIGPCRMELIGKMLDFFKTSCCS